MSKQILHKNIWSNSYIPILCFLFGLVSSDAVPKKMNDVSLESFKCENVEYLLGADFVTIACTYRPQNGTPFWFKCFKGVNNTNYIAYSFVSAKTTCIGPIGNRTSLTIFKQENWTSIKLKIDRPNPSGDGLHICKLEGKKKTMKAFLLLQGHAKPSTGMDMTTMDSNNGEKQGHLALITLYPLVQHVLGLFATGRRGKNPKAMNKVKKSRKNSNGTLWSRI